MVLGSGPVCLLYLNPRAVKEHSQHTIGVEFSSRTVKLGEKRIKLQVSYFVSKEVMKSLNWWHSDSYGIRRGRRDFGTCALMKALYDINTEPSLYISVP